jgi:PIN domain nuclease of toxin-antitoxin system
LGKVTCLLDTHIFLWWLFNDPKLPVGIRELIENVDNPVLVSSASVWEIATKFRLGKLPEAANVAGNVSSWIEKAGFQTLAISPRHAQLAGEWTLPHRDPFDRMLAAQAKLENISLITVDKALLQFPVKIIQN